MSQPQITITVIHGSLLDQVYVDAFVNPWNPYFFVPCLLLVPHGVSGVLKKVTGPAPWKQLTHHGVLSTGEAVMTNGGKLKQDLIHVAGLNAFWVATDESISKSARSAVELAWANNYGSVAMPLIGAGVGGKGQDYVLNLIQESIQEWTVTSPVTNERVMEVRLVVWN